MAYFGISDVSRITIDGSNEKNLNWTEITVPEILMIPNEKPNIESINQIYADVKVTSVKLIETPFAYEESCDCTVATSDQIAAGNAIVALIDALNLDTVATTVIDPVQALLNTISALDLSIFGISLNPFIAPIQTTLDLVENTITSINNLLVTLTTALTTPTTTICTLSTLFTELQSLLNTLLSALSTLLEQLQALLEEIEQLVATIPGIGLVLAIVLATLQTLLGTVTPIINTLITGLGQVLTAIATLLNTLCPNCIKLIPNEEGMLLTGRKLIVEGTITQKVVYTALLPTQPVHSAHYCMPFSAYIIAYAKFESLTYNLENDCFSYTPGQPIIVDLNEEFNVTPYIEDIFAYALDERTIFKNVTLFLKAQPKI